MVFREYIVGQTFQSRGLRLCWHSAGVGYVCRVEICHCVVGGFLRHVDACIERVDGVATVIGAFHIRVHFAGDAGDWLSYFFTRRRRY
ncbi:hypothetical protein D3C81_2010770 [compost metagenome]